MGDTGMEEPRTAVASRRLVNGTGLLFRPCLTTHMVAA